VVNFWLLSTLLKWNSIYTPKTILMSSIMYLQCSMVSFVLFYKISCTSVKKRLHNCYKKDYMSKPFVSKKIWFLTIHYEQFGFKGHNFFLDTSFCHEFRHSNSTFYPKKSLGNTLFKFRLDVKVAYKDYNNWNSMYISLK